MLDVYIPPKQFWDEGKEEFVYTDGKHIQVEHSLISISKWESKWKKPFLNNSEPRTYEETIDYVRCMTLTRGVDPVEYYALGKEDIDRINEYIDDKHTATWFSKGQGQGTSKTSEQVTSELIYYWMIAHNIPVEFEKWHLNRLMTLIRICNLKQEKPKKMNRRQLLAQNRNLNAIRRAKSGSRG